MIRVNFTGYALYTTDALTQWDIDQGLEVTGVTIDTDPTVLFSNRSSVTAVVVQATYKDGVIKCDIPNELLEDPYPIYAYVRIKNGSSYTTIAKIKIPVDPATKPDDYIYSKNIDILEALTLGINSEDGLLYIYVNGNPVGLGVEIGAVLVNVTGVSITPNDVEILDRSKAPTLKAVIEPADATNTKVVWSSSDDRIVTVRNGVLTPVSNGSAIISVTTRDGGYVALSNVTVNIPISVTGIRFNTKVVNIEVDSKYGVNMDYSILPADASNKRIKSWRSSNEGVAIVDDNGFVYPKMIGSAVISATTEDGSYTDNYTANIYEAYPYPTEGIIADYDAINNTGSGHDADSSVWADLSGHGYNIDLTEAKGVTGKVTKAPSGPTSGYQIKENTYYWADESLYINIRNFSEFEHGAYIPITPTPLNGVSVVMAGRASMPASYGALLRLYKEGDPHTASQVAYNNIPAYPYNGNNGMSLKSINIGNSFLSGGENTTWIYTEDLDGNYKVYHNNELYLSGKVTAVGSFTLGALEFFQRFNAELKHVSVFDHALTDIEVRDVVGHLDKKYGVGGLTNLEIGSIASGTVYPYIELPVNAFIEPADKRANTVISGTSTDANVMEVLNDEN